MTGPGEMRPEVFVVHGEMPAGHFSQTPHTSAHRLLYRNRIGEPGLAAECEGCPGWKIGLPPSRGIEMLMKLDAQHTGEQLVLIRQKGGITETTTVDPSGKVVFARTILVQSVKETDMSFSLAVSGHAQDAEHEHALFRELVSVLGKAEHGVSYSHFAGSHIQGTVHGEAGQYLADSLAPQPEAIPQPDLGDDPDGDNTVETASEETPASGGFLVT